MISNGHPTFLSTAGTISVFSNFFAFYLIFFQSGSMGTYRFYLLYFMVSSLFLDFLLSFFVRPIVYFPLLIATSDGLFKKINLSAHLQFDFLLFVITLQLVTMLISLFKKHQSVAEIGQLLLAEKFFPTYLNILKSEYTILYSYEESIFMPITVYFMIFMFLTYSPILFFLYFQIFQMLHSHRIFISTLTYAKHSSAVISLGAQAVVLMFWLLIPIIFCLFVVIFQIQGVEEICNILICIYSTHSLASTLTMCITFPSFRRFLLCNSNNFFGSSSIIIAPKTPTNIFKTPKNMRF